MKTKIILLFFVSVITACAKRAGTAASRRCEPDRVNSSERLKRGGASP